MITHIFKNPAVEAMRAMALRLLQQGRIEWRHHGIGVLQGYIREHREIETRFHLWAPELIKPGMVESGDVHDHRFDLVSHVLYGAVGHEEWNETKSRTGAYQMLALTHARAASDTNYHGPTEALPGRYAVKKTRWVIHPGESYRFPAQYFHRSLIVGDLAITCVEKHAQTDIPARLLYPRGKEPVMAFGHQMDHGLVLRLVERAIAALDV